MSALREDPGARPSTPVAGPAGGGRSAPDPGSPPVSGLRSGRAAGDDLPDLDRLVHEPARLAILTVLSSCASADFLFLRSLTGLTNGNLSSHLSKLEAGGLVQIEKRFVDRKPNTVVRLTPAGREGV